MIAGRGDRVRRGAVSLVAAATAALCVCAPASAQDACADARTQSELNRCAREALRLAEGREAEAARALDRSLSPRQREAFRESRRAWQRWRAAQCTFESSASAGGSARAMVESQCAIRLTEARTAELARLAACPEGDLGCPRRAP